MMASERQGALQGAGENIEELLPDDEREKRRKEKQQARWTINVGLDHTIVGCLAYVFCLQINVIANIVLLTGKLVAAFYSNSLSLIASLVDSALDLLCTLIVWTTNRLVLWRLNSLRRRFPVRFSTAEISFHPGVDVGE